MRYFPSLILLLFLQFCFFATGARAETITLVADRWCPYNCDPNTDHQGFMVDIAQRAFAKHNIDLKYAVLPWSRAIQETRDGKYTALVGASRSDAPDFIFPTISQGWMQNAFFVPKESTWHYTDVKSLDTVSLGLVADYTYNKALDAYITRHKNDAKRIQFIAGNDALDVNLKKLQAGRIGTLLEATAVMNYRLKQHNLVGEIVEAGKLPLSPEDDLFIAFDPHNKHAARYAAILEKETQAMRENGELLAILQRYGLQDWKNQDGKK